MDKNVLFEILKSLIITISVAAILAFFATSVLPLSFLPSFLVFILAQFLIFYFYGEYIKNKNNRLQVEAEVKIAESLSSQETTVVCPCDRNIPATIPISIKGPNSYICKGCNKEISVFVETKTALTTTPVVANPLTEPYFVENVKKLISDDNRKQE